VGEEDWEALKRGEQYSGNADAALSALRTGKAAKVPETRANFILRGVMTCISGTNGGVELPECR